MEYNKDQLKAFAENIHLPEIALNEAEPVCELWIKTYADKYESIKTFAFVDESNDEIVKIIKAIAEKEGIEKDLVMLSAVLLLGMDAHERYRKENISDEVYYDSMKDITIWTKTCMKEAGHVGLYEFGWIMSFIRAEIIRLHRLEFHQIRFNPADCWQKDDLTVNKGDRVINIHVPEDGPLKHEDVIESYRRAYRYFGKAGKAAFVCHSWLLYPGMLEFLSEKSNIRAFAEDFDIIEVDHAKNSGDLWRIFGKRRSYNPAELPRENSLQRGMADYLAAHDNVTGSAYGIFAFDGEKIIK